MANIFDKTIKKRHITSLNETQLDKEIIAKKEEMKALSAELKSVQKASKSLDTSHEKRSKQLRNEMNAFLKSLDSSEKELSNEVIKLQNREAVFAEENQKAEDEIDAKINSLIESRKKLLASKSKKDVNEFNKEKNRIEKRLKTLEKTKEEQFAKYEADLKKLDEDFNKIKEINNKTLAEINKEYDETSNKFSKEISSLEKEKEEAIINSKDVINKTNIEINKIVSDQHAVSGASLDEKRAELNKLYIEADSLQIAVKAAKQQLDNKQKALNDEYEFLVNQLKDKEEAASKTNEALQHELELKTADLKERIASHKVRIKAKNAELAEIVKAFEETEKKAAKDPNVIEQAVKSKYDILVNDLNQKYLQEKESLAQEKETLEYELTKQQEELTNRNAYLQSKYNEIKFDRRRTIADQDAIIAEAKEKLESLKNNNSLQIANLKEEIADIKSQTDNDLANRDAVLKTKLENIKYEYKKNIQDVEKSIQEITVQIDGLNESVTYYDDQIQKVTAEGNQKIESLVRNNEAYLENVEKTRNKIQSDIEAADAKIAELKIKNDAEFEQLEQKKAAIQEDYNKRLIKQNEYFLQTEESFETRYNKFYKEQEANYSTNIASLREKMNKEMAELNIKAIEQQSASDEQYQQINSDIESLKETIEKQITSLHDERDNVLNQIEEVKKKHAEIIDSLKSERDAIETNHVNMVNTLLENHEINLKGLESQYRDKLDETNARLSEAYKQLAEKKIKLDNSNEVYNSTKIETSERIDALLLEQQNQHQQLSDELQSKQEEYRIKSEDCKRIISELNESLKVAQQNCNDFESSLNTSLSERRAEIDGKLKALDEEFDGKLKAFIAQCKEKEDAFENDCNFEIEARKNELKIKEEILKKNIDEIKARKEATSEALKTRYESELGKTSVLENEYDNFVKVSQNIRDNLQKEIEEKRIQIDNDLNVLKEKNNESVKILSDKYEDSIRIQNDKVENISREVEQLNGELLEKESLLRQYKLDGESRINIILANTESYQKEITAKLEELSRKNQDLNKTHDENVEYLMGEINKYKDEYEDLLRAKPAYVKEIDERYINAINEKKEKFKSNLVMAEQSFTEIIDQFTLSRDDSLARIAQDNDAVSNENKKVVDQYDKEIAELNSNYDKMIKAEQARQQAIHKKLDEADNQKKDILFKHDSTLKRLDKELEDSKKKLAESFDLEKKMKKEVFDGKISELAIKAESLTNGKNALTAKMADLKRQEDDYNEYLTVQTQNLITAYKAGIINLQNTYEKTFEEQRNSWRSVDMMSDDVFDIFKKGK